MSAARLLDPCLRVHLHRGPARPDNDALCGAPGCGNPATHFATLYFYDAVARRAPYMPGEYLLNTALCPTCAAAVVTDPTAEAELTRVLLAEVERLGI